MHLSRIIGITLLPLMLTYCTNKETKEALASAESLMWVKPDSALTIMESIDTLRINGRASKALYSLLYSMALDRNHVVVTDSRIITQAVKYYERHGSPDDRFKSLCYLGRIQNAANEYDKAIVCFKESGDDDFVRMMEVNKAKNYVSMMDYHAADSLFRKIINDESFPLYYRAYSMAAYGLLLSFGQLADEKKALGLFEEAIRLSGDHDILSLNQECAYAYLLDMVGRKNDSKRIISELQKKGQGESTEFNYCMGRIYRLNGENGLAFDYLVKSTQDFDAKVLKMQIQSSSVAQKNYYLERSHEREKELIIHHFWTICYVTVSIILILSVGILFYKKARKVEEERRRILILKETTDIRLDEADKSIAQIKTDYDIIKKNYLELYLSQGSWLEKLADILYSAQDKNLKPYGLRAAVYDKISDMIGGINVDDAGQKRFEAELNKLYGGIMTQFRREFHDLLDETDIRFFSCVVARFEASIILRIFNLPSKSAVYMKKNRLKEKIRKSKAPDKDKFLLF